jgi:hypothetical protein
MVWSLTAAERETTVTTTDADDLVIIESTRPRHISAMRRNPRFTEIESGRWGATEWARFSIPDDMWNPATGAKRRITMTDEQKRANTERLRAARARRSGDA